MITYPGVDAAAGALWCAGVALAIGRNLAGRQGRPRRVLVRAGRHRRAAPACSRSTASIVEISSFGGDARVQQAMTADGIDIGLGSGPGLAFIVKGSPVKGIAAMADPPLTFALVVRNDGEIKTLDDLKGKKVGVSTVGSVTGWLVGETARQKGWGYDGMQLTPIGDDASRVAAVKTKSIDGAVVNLAVAFNYAQRGDGRVLLLFGDLLKDFHVHVIFATDKAIAGKPEALRKFLAGWFETIAFMRKDKAKTRRDRPGRHGHRRARPPRASTTP